MPQDFNFRPDNAYVTNHLSPNDIHNVQVWQEETLDYQFSFHTQHEAGWPCYLVETDGPNRNLPKINLKVPGNAPLLQGESVRDNDIGANFAAVIRANIPQFQTLARAYYDVETDEPVTGPLWVVRYTCNKDKKAPVLTFGLPRRAQGNMASAFWSNMKGRTTKPSCKLHRNSACLVETVVLIPANESAAVKTHYNDSGEVINL
ncbi:MAG TPA: hypothetical protein VG168_07935 [Bryobacteraceae bacterium]|nr:hypothetical protein [Bryobacteraceae bacterium]